MALQDASPNEFTNCGGIDNPVSFIPQVQYIKTVQPVNFVQYYAKTDYVPVSAEVSFKKLEMPQQQIENCQNPGVAAMAMAMPCASPPMMPMMPRVDSPIEAATNFGPGASIGWGTPNYYYPQEYVNLPYAQPWSQPQGCQGTVAYVPAPQETPNWYQGPVPSCAARGANALVTSGPVGVANLYGYNAENAAYANLF